MTFSPHKGMDLAKICISKMVNLRTIEAQIRQKLKNNEARPKFTGSYGKKACRTNLMNYNGFCALRER